MRLPPGTRVLRTPQELDAVAAPLRVAILEHLGHADRASVSDLARLLDRPATALHYHVTVLRRAGLIVPAGHRAAGRRSEVLYTLAAPSFAVAGRSNDRASLAAAARTLGVTLRLAHREASRAMVSPSISAAGPGRTLHARRLSGPLSPPALARVNRLLDQLEAIFVAEQKGRVRSLRHTRSTALSPADLRPIGLTFVLAPVRSRRRAEPQEKS